MQKNKATRDFPGGVAVKNPSANAGHRFNPWSGKIPHAMEQLSPCATTTEPTSLLLKPARLEPVLCNEKPPQ